MGALTGVKVGDEVVVTGRWSANGPERDMVTAIGRVYATIGGEQYRLDTGVQKGPIFGHGRRFYTLAQWERRMLEDALRTAARKVYEARANGVSALTDDEIREATRVLEEVARKIGGGS